jgi:hypothetical protein
MWPSLSLRIFDMRKIEDLCGWAPFPGVATGRGSKAVNLVEVLIDEVVVVADTYIDFLGIWERTVNFRFDIPDKETAEKVAAILRENRGKPLLSIASHPIPED